MAGVVDDPSVDIQRRHCVGEMDDRGMWEGHPAVQKWDGRTVPSSHLLFTFEQFPRKSVFFQKKGVFFVFGRGNIGKVHRLLNAIIQLFHHVAYIGYFFLLAAYFQAFFEIGRAHV